MLRLSPVLLTGALLALFSAHTAFAKAQAAASEVVAVTGRETFDTPVGTLSQPILATRQASTRVRIKEGQAFAPITIPA